MYLIVLRMCVKLRSINGAFRCTGVHYLSLGHNTSVLFQHCNVLCGVGVYQELSVKADKDGWSCQESFDSNCFSYFIYIFSVHSYLQYKFHTDTFTTFNGSCKIIIELSVIKLGYYFLKYGIYIGSIFLD